ncbi:hypothetical protein BGI41_07725 [Methanobrevibacter sp. 87.7]|uniref:right-handed parallel beta-helix repeat-containing protein n=1 Tax=Methanobrevibacter sp. 87.7 TaxID=387957 RepID=UPI000B512D63|nr:right-handed parallel beta-helix repeat-containing protein [Methanobrevibacter sp. 87.7]OWT32425.1 hypothetical protein BGI41_07725 [Methanobrevibacter sp. 87.7]
MKNNKKLIIFVLLLFVIINIGCVSAATSSNDTITTNSNSVNIQTTDNTSTVLSEEVDTPSTIDVDNSMSNADIQSKIDGAKDGDTINFANGTYENTNLLINKTLILNGNGATLTGVPSKGLSQIENGAGTYKGIFYIENCNNTIINGFNFIVDNAKLNTSVNMTNDGGVNTTTQSNVVFHNTSNVKFINNTVSGGRYGIFVTSAFNGFNKNTLIENNTVSNVLDGGIESFGSEHTIIRNNIIINPYNHGIDVRHGTGPNCVIVNNTIYNAQEGIYLMHSAGHICENNTLNHCSVGITCFGSANIKTDYNNFTNNTMIGYMLASGYSNITIGGNDDFTGLKWIPMPPTFTYKIVTGDSKTLGNSNGTYTDSAYVSRINTTIVAPQQFDQYAVDFYNGERGGYFTVTLKDQNNNTLSNKPVQIGFNGVIYNLTTDENGIAKLQINLAWAGDYTFAICYLGDDQYNGSFVVSKIHITKKAVSLTVPYKYTLNTKTKAITVTLKATDYKGTYVNVANKKVTVTVNGKTYTGTTNANGVATVKVSINKKGTYTVTTKFTGNNVYQDKTTTSKIRIY